MKNLKTFMLSFVFALMLVPLITSCSSNKKEKKQDKRPNILFIMSDDHTTQAITAYNKIYADYFTTPNIDRIANEGIRFDNVYCANAICGPSRAIII